MLKNGTTLPPIPTEPQDVYNVLEALLQRSRADWTLPVHEHAAIAYAMGAMQVAFPITFKREG